jgi:hypothetical protein
VVYATSENRTDAAQPLPDSAVPGDATAVRVVTGEIPVRFM